MSAAVDPRATDREQRRRARSAFGAPVLVSAGAGAGKTSALVARIVCWCLGPGWTRHATAPGAAPDRAAIAERVLARCVAVTFTEKAAAEMEERVGAALEDLAAGRMPLHDFALSELDLDAAAAAQRARALLDAFDALRVGTLHAFCARILREHALAAELHPDFAIDAGDGELARACREFVSLRLGDGYGDPGDARALRLAEAGIGAGAFVDALARASGERIGADALGADPCGPGRVAAEQRGLAAALDALLEPLERALSTYTPKGKEATARTRDALRTLRAALEHPLELDALLDHARAAHDAGSKALARWAGGDAPKGVAAALGAELAAFERLARALADRLRDVARCEPEVLRAAASLLAEWSAAFERERRARGLATFQDLIGGAAELLEREAEISASIAAGIDQLLVDEFQDTDDVQCRLLRALALRGPRDGRPGLFVVGDPKQSIYGWRGADLGAYEAFRKECEAAGGIELSLRANFRSSAAVLDEVARLCRPTLRADPGRQWAFEPLLEARAKSADARLLDPPRAAIECWSSWGSSARGNAAAGRELAATPAELARRIEAAAIAADLADLGARGFRYEHAAILLRSTGAQWTYLDALRERGIPCAPSKDKSFYRTAEIQELSNLLLAALAPSDALALAGAARSAAVGVPDGALPHLWRRGLPERWSAWRGPEEAAETLRAWCAEAERRLAEDPDAASFGIDRIAGWSAAAADGLARLLELRASFATTRGDRWVDAWRAWFLPEERAAIAYLGGWRRANVARALFALERALALERSAPHELARALREGLSGEREEAIALPSDAGPAVSVLTLHAAKGLEWPLVYVPDLQRVPRARSTERVELARGPQGTCLSVGGARALGWSDMLAERRARNQAEDARLLYVAATRAAERLVLVGLWPAAGTAHSSAPLLGLVLQREGARGFEQVTDAAGFRDAHGVLWKLPGLHGHGFAETNAAPAADAGPAQPFAVQNDVQAWRDEAAAFDRARAQAAAFARRPSVAGMSHADDRDAADPEVDADLAPVTAQIDPRVLGSLVHAWFEQPLDARALAARAALLGARDPAAHAAAALELLDAPAVRALVARLRALEPHVLGREVPIATPPLADAGPTLARTGQVDLLYRDPRDGALVVADYKTDRDVDARAARERHAPQLAEYARVLADALGAPVRAELWMLRSGEVLALELTGT